MSVDRRGSSKQGPDTTAQRAPTVPAVGKSTLIESRYPALDQALRHGGAARDGEPTIHDAATAAIEGKDGGAALDAGVAARRWPPRCRFLGRAGA
jgi:hypothetical protein